jgi:hypothetical protein
MCCCFRDDSQTGLKRMRFTLWSRWEDLLNAYRPVAPR